VLPLVPGYLSYVTGLAGADLDAALGAPPAANPPAANPPAENGAVTVAAPPRLRGRGRVLAGTGLFVLGFTVVYTLLATLVSRLGLVVGNHRRLLDVAVGLLIIGFGLAFLGLIPGAQREWRIHRLPAAGLLGAPVLGAFFAFSWVPCTGPTLGAVLGLASRAGQTDRAATLAVAYCLGVGIPFVLFGLFFRRLLGVFTVVRRHSRWVTRIGGALLIAVGLALVTGGWNDFVIWLQTTFAGGETLL
jgi:cytochrome c-type biogenesis protein